MKTTGNIILITRSTSGIGLAFAKEFFKEGNKVIITGRRSERLDEISKSLPGIVTKVSDVTDEAQRKDLVDWLKQNHPEMNVLLNNAGIQLVTDLTKPIDLERVHSEIKTNFIAPVHLTSLIVPLLAKKDNAAIINITSGLAFTPIAFMPVYCATKAAMHSLTISLRHQVKEMGIKVFEIAPPAVDTELGHQRREDKNESHGGIPVGEFIEEAINAIKNDRFEATVGLATEMRSKPEAMFEQLNFTNIVDNFN